MQKNLLLLVTFVTLRSFGSVAAGQTVVSLPPLGSLTNFALYTAVGAVSNVGPLTYITGNVGTNLGAMTGFPTSSISGGSAMVANFQTGQAAMDVQTVYAALKKYSCTTTSLAPAMGGGITLAPGVYCFGGAASVASDVYLDGQRDPASVFIFKINGALTTAATSRVMLINGAQSDHVFWQVNGAASFAAQSVFSGIIVAAGALDLSDGVTLNGKGFSTVGAISTYNTQITSAISRAPLPVELVSFTTQALNGTGELRWETASEKDNAYFGVESSADGRTFTPLGTVAGQGTSAQRHSYTWSDGRLARYASPVVYYRLREVATNNTVTYSPVQLVKLVPCAAPVQVQAYPNPFQGPVSLALESAQAQAGTLRLSDAQGHLLVQRALTLPAGRSMLALPETAALRPGVYFLQFQTGAQRQHLTLVRQ